MLSIARTLMGNPVLLLLDEPSEGVAPIIVEDLANALLVLKRQGLSILLSEQNVAFAQIIADRVYILEQGQIRWTGMMQELARNSEIQRSYLAL
jgi:branched-chain amino acid transport system ATP-binding protein